MSAKKKKERMPGSWLAGLVVVLGVVGFSVWQSYSSGIARLGADEEELVLGPIVVGSVLPLSGDRADEGALLQEVFELALGEVETDGGVRGFPMNHVVRDSECRADKAVEAARDMVEDTGVTVLFGGVCSEEARALADYAQEVSVLLVTPAAAIADISEGRSYVYRTVLPEARVAEVLGGHLLGEDAVYGSMVLVRDSSEHMDRFVNEVTSVFVNTVDSFAIIDIDEREEIDTDSVVERIVEAEPDLVVFAVSEGFVVTPLVQALPEDFASQLVLHELASPETLAEDVGDLLAGALYFSVFLDRDDENVVRVLEQIETEERGALDVQRVRMVLNAYSQVFLIRDAFVAVGIETDKLRGFLDGLSQWRGGVFRGLTFDEEGNPLKSVLAHEYRDGRFVQIESY